MNSKYTGLAALALAALTACSDSTAQKTCADFCGSGNVCQDGQCVALQAASCADAYPGCAACDTGGATPAWVGQCGAGTTCSATTDTCTPTPCSPACGAGTACQNGACVAVEAVTCAAPYPGCASCIVSGQAATWQGLCGSGTTCNPGSDRCEPVTTTLHATLTKPGFPLAGPFTTGYALTQACLQCHAPVATQVMATAHWTWSGPTPDLLAMSRFSVADPLAALNPGNIGKVNLINNFCVGVPSNEKRCDQCHAGYGGDPDAAKPQKTARAYTLADSSIPLEARVDCLVCHADPARYSKNPKDFGKPNATVDLKAAAETVALPTRANCGACHFFAGGGDNVKLMGSGLKNPTEATDVHMGRGMTCADCHATSGHAFKGSGVHVPTHTARVACADCHGSTPHFGVVAANGDTLDEHTAKLACQTCHIPKFSKTQFTKMDWDWSTAGDNKTCAGTPGPCVAGVVVNKVNEDGTLNPDSALTATSYDYIKGSFVWQRNVTPAYRWSNGTSTHATTGDRADLAGMGVTPADADRITLGEPVGGPADGKIMPFKLMRGRQAMYVDGASSFVINPNVFGPGSFWGVIQAVGYDFPTYTFDAGTAPGQPSVDKLWGKILAVGAAAAGQVPPGTPAFAKYDGVNPGYDWRYTRLYMDMNHEVSPKAQALGAAGCVDCHSASPRLPLCELYAGRAKPWGVTCP